MPELPEMSEMERRLVRIGYSPADLARRSPMPTHARKPRMAKARMAKAHIAKARVAKPANKTHAKHSL